MAAATKKEKKRKEEAYPWEAGASSGHHRAILLEATSYIHVIRKLWESTPTRVGSNIVTSVNSYKYILLMYQKNVCLKRNKKVLYSIKCTSFNDVLRSVFIYFLP